MGGPDVLVGPLKSPDRADLCSVHCTLFCVLVGGSIYRTKSTLVRISWAPTLVEMHRHSIRQEHNSQWECLKFFIMVRNNGRRCAMNSGHRYSGEEDSGQ